MGHLREYGFEVEARDVSGSELHAKKEAYGIPRELESCHTAEVGGYVFEGHVPADLIAEVLNEMPDLTGLAIPGMPPGAPGMGGDKSVPIEVLALDQDGSVWVYARR